MQEIYKDRKKFSKAVFEVASSDLVNMGIYVVSYTLKDIRDEEVSATEIGNVYCFLSRRCVSVAVKYVPEWFEKQKIIE